MAKLRVKPGHLHWHRFDPDDTGPFKEKDEAAAETERHIQELDTLQDRLYAEGKQSLLIILQGMDTSGKDGTIRHVMRGANPQSCRVTNFKVPTLEEKAHDFLWRIHKHAPAAGYIGIFNRSHYEDVLVTRVHRKIPDDEAERRFHRIRDFEKWLAQNRTVVLKFYLGISKGEQRKRLEERLRDPHKRWKFSLNDIAERKHWDRYMKYYKEAITATTTDSAPWYLIPANHKWYRNYCVAKVIVKTLKDMDPQYPPAAPGIDPRKIRIPA